MPNRPTKDEIERKAIDTYGEPHQILKCMEELAELMLELCVVLMPTQKMGKTHLAFSFAFLPLYASVIKETCKSLGQIEESVELTGIDNDANIRLELADVKITAGDQMPMIFGQTQNEEDAKLTRLARNMGMMEGAEPCE